MSKKPKFDSVTTHYVFRARSRNVDYFHDGSSRNDLYVSLEGAKKAVEDLFAHHNTKKNPLKFEKDVWNEDGTGEFWLGPVIVAVIEKVPVF